MLRLLPPLVLLLALAADGLSAQRVRALRLVSDNDAYAFWTPLATRPDHGYTNGLVLAAEVVGAPAWARALVPGAAACARSSAPDACLTTSLRLGQDIYTPRLLNDRPAPGDRPYAGWLYLAADVRAATPTAERALGLDVGVTGPPSLGEEVQETWHRITGFYEPEGWEEQLRFEPGVVVRYEERHLVGSPWEEGRGPVDAVPYAGGEAGNVRTGAWAGVRVRAGWNLPHPWLPAPPRGAGAYVFAGGRADAVLRNLFLDGNTFADGPSVDREPLVGTGEVGIGARWRGFTAEYRAVRRTREFAGQTGNHPYGAFSLSLTLPR